MIWAAISGPWHAAIGIDKLPEGYTPVSYDQQRNVWLIRNPKDQSEMVEVLPYSVPTVEIKSGLVPFKAVRWSDVRG